MPLHQSVQLGLLQAAALGMNRCAIRFPARPADGLHAGLPKWCARTVSRLVPRLNRSECRLLVGACLCGASL